jgi:hypothetical protein
VIYFTAYRVLVNTKSVIELNIHVIVQIHFIVTSHGHGLPEANYSYLKC